MAETLFLSSDEVAGLATAGEYVDEIRKGYRQRGEGAPAEPRTKLINDDPKGMFTGYLAILPDTGAMGGYVYSGGFGSRDAWFVFALYDVESGRPLAIFDGASMNPYKTGAVGAVGVDELARDDATHLAIIGSGSQARGQLRSVATIRDLDCVDVYSPTKEHRESFATEFDERLEATVSAVDSSAAAIEGADIVITATTSREPVFDGQLLEPGTHVTAMGQYGRKSREIDVTTIERSVYVPDLRERIHYDAGAFIRALEEGAVTEDHVHAELGEIVAGTAPGRQSDDEITVFDSGGTGIETVAAAHMLYNRAREQGLGTSLEFVPASEAFDA